MNVLVTGGSSGLGAAITRRIAIEKDCKVYFTYNQSADEVKRMEVELGNVFAIKCDFKNADEVAALKEQIAALDIDVLVNNAYTGEVVKTHFHKIPVNDFLTGFTDNIIPTIVLTQAAISSFRKKKAGKIITMLTSGLINTPPAGSAVYNANKAYLQQLTKVWAAENARYNITSNSVSPAFMQTTLTSSIDERLVEQIIENHPLKKLLTVEEVADTVFFLVNATSQINGVDILLNAGVNMR